MKQVLSICVLAMAAFITPSVLAQEAGCTPGFWKQDQHFDKWVSYSPDDYYEIAFEVDASFSDVTLFEALKQGGGGDRALGRHAVAALLNASNPDIEYLYTDQEVISIVQGAYATGEFEAGKDLLDAANDTGTCPH